MIKIRFLILILALDFFSCNHTPKNHFNFSCSESCKAKSKSGALTCKLTSSEFQIRKEKVLSLLQSKVIEKWELEDGYAFKFTGSDSMIDELTEFIKSERNCCDFFTFNLSISGDKSEVFLSLTGEKGVKEIISAELGL